MVKWNIHFVRVLHCNINQERVANKKRSTSKVVSPASRGTTPSLAFIQFAYINHPLPTAVLIQLLNKNTFNENCHCRRPSRNRFKVTRWSSLTLGWRLLRGDDDVVGWKILQLDQRRCAKLAVRFNYLMYDFFNFSVRKKSTDYK